MAKKNILGEGFPKYVREQVKIRQEGLGEDPISNASIIKNDGKTAWLKFASSVDLNAQAQRELSITANLPENIERQNYLARSLVLYNGTYNHFLGTFGEGIAGPSLWNGDVINLDTGNIVGSGTVSTQGGAYGFGGFEQGAVPMPGVIDFKVTPRNRGGIRDATINIQANNLRQFQLLESLYLRLGYHVLIEWGWTNYYDNDGNLIIRDDVQSPVLAAFLHTGQSAEYYNILDLISKEKEKSDGNYDALLGRIVNFNWTLREGGGYNISIRILSAGDILDSLKLPNLPTSEIALLNNQLEALENQSEDTPLPMNAGIYASTPQANKSSLHRWLWLIEHILQPDTDEAGKEVQFGQPATGIREFRDYYINLFTKDFGITPEWRPYTGTGIFGANGSYLTEIVPGTDARYKVKTSYGEARLKRIGAWFGQFRTSNTNILNKETQVRDYYVSFGNVLGFISKTLLYYNQNTEQPIIDIDFDLDNNLCYTYPIVPELCNTTTLSVNDDICLVNAYANVGTPGNSSIQSLWPNVFPLQDDKFNEGATNSHGRIMAINLTTSFVKRCADSAYDTVEHTINLQKFLDALLEGINSCFYGTINLVTQIDPDTNILYILDLSQIPDINSLGIDTTLTKFRVSGYNLGEASFLKEVNITSEISKNIANQLVIGAQQSGNVVSNVPTSLTQFNQGYTDRVFTKKLDSYQTNQQIALADAKRKKDEELQAKKETAALKLFLAQYKIFTHYIVLALDNRLPSDTSQTQYYNIVESIVKWELSQITSDMASTRTDSGDVNLQGQNPPGYIPISLNLTMEGLAGMRLFNKFTITEEYLPFSYRNQFDFIIKGITHELKNNYWNTMIESLCVPKPRNILGAPPSGDGIGTTTPAGTNGTSGGSSDGSSRSRSKCATDPNDNFGRLVSDETQIPSPWNKKYTATQNKNIIYTLFRIAGFTQTQAAVALANAQAESSFNNLANGDSCQSYGLFQTHTTKGVAIEALRGKYKNSLLANLDTRYAFFNPYVNTLVILDQAFRYNLKKDLDIASATTTFVDKIERPNDRAGAKKTRGIYALNYINYSPSIAEVETVLTELSQYKFTVSGNRTLSGTEVLSQLIYYYGVTLKTRNITVTDSDAAAINFFRKKYLPQFMVKKRIP
jgi:hypothetical protein